MDKIETILEVRGTRYGEFCNQAALSQALSNLMKGFNPEKWNSLPPYMRESLEMIQHKIARILNGDPYYDDSWVDVIGYAQLAVDELRTRSTPK